MPPGGDTIFEIGSITKLFTATLLADMAGEGLVRLDDAVARHLPEGVRLPERSAPVTLADLASHTAGLPRLPRGMLRRSLRHRRNPYAGYTVQDLHVAVNKARLRRRRRPRYSNFGFGLLGHVLALRAHAGYEALVEQRICRPLRLADTSIVVPGDRLARFAQGHDRRGRPVPHWDLPALPGAGGLRSTVDDLLVFIALHLGEGDSGLVHAARVTREPRARLGSMRVGLGWMDVPLRGRSHRVLFHNGGTGGFRSFCGVVVSTRTAVAVLASSARSVDAVGMRLLEAMP